MDPFPHQFPCRLPWAPPSDVDITTRSQLIFPVQRHDRSRIQEEPIEKTTVASIARRLFSARNAQTWPPVIVAHSSWHAIYIKAADGLAVRTDVDKAVIWANEFVAAQSPLRLLASGSRRT